MAIRDEPSVGGRRDLAFARPCFCGPSPPRPPDGPGRGHADFGRTWGLGNGAPAVVALGCIFLTAFVLWEARAPHPMVPLSLFRDQTFAAANLATFLIYTALSTVLFFLPMTLIAGWAVPEIMASLAFAPLSVFIGGLSARVGVLSDRYGPGRMIGMGGAVVSLAFIWLASLAPIQSFWVSVVPGTTLLGLGMALVVSPLSTAIMAAVPPDRSGTASGLNNAISRVAGLMAVAVMGGLAASEYAQSGGTASFGAFSDAPGHADAMTAAFRQLCWIAAALTAFGAACAYALMSGPDTVAKR